MKFEGVHRVHIEVASSLECLIHFILDRGVGLCLDFELVFARQFLEGFGVSVKPSREVSRPRQGGADLT